MFADRLRAAVAGLAAITPCAGYVETYAVIIIGGLAGLICHVLGTFLLGFSGARRINSIGASGLLYGGGGHLLGEQVLAIVVVVAFSFCLAWTRQVRVSCGLAVLGMWAACGAVKVKLCRRQGGGFRQTGSVLSVALFGAAGRRGSPRS